MQPHASLKIFCSKFSELQFGNNIVSPHKNETQQRLGFGRFARHQNLKFVVHNMIMHKRAAENARFVVNQKLGDRHLTVADLKEQIQNGNQSQGRKVCILVQDLAAAHNTGHRKGKELRALIQY